MGRRKTNRPSLLYFSSRSDEEITNLFPDTFIPEDDHDDDGSDRYVLVAGGSNKGDECSLTNVDISLLRNQIHQR